MSFGIVAISLLCSTVWYFFEHIHELSGFGEAVLDFSSLDFIWSERGGAWCGGHIAVSAGWSAAREVDDMIP